MRLCLNNDLKDISKVKLKAYIENVYKRFLLNVSKH